MKHFHVARRLACACLVACLAAPAAAQGLPPAIEADRQLQLAASEMAKADRGDKADWALVAQALKSAEATGVRMPAGFDYHQGRALHAMGEHAAALQRLERYLRVQGQQGKYYSEALALFTQAQAAQAQGEAAQRRQAQIDAAWVNLRTRWWSTDETDDGCSRAQSRIQRYAPSARGFDCDCQIGYVNHPAWRDRQEVVCRVSWQGNLLQEQRSSFVGDRSFRTDGASGSTLEGMKTERR